MRWGGITLRELIALVRAKADRDSPYTIYSKDSDYDAFTLDTRVHVAPTDPYVEVPDDIVGLGLSVFCDGSLLQDVVDHALAGYDDVTDDQLIAGLETYLVHDAFMDYEIGATSGRGGRAIWGGGKWGRVGRLNPDGTVKPPRS